MEQKLYTSINEFKEALGNYEVLLFDTNDGALVKGNRGNYYYYTYDSYNEELLKPYLNQKRIDDEEERQTYYRDLPLDEDEDAADVLEAFLNDEQPEIVLDYDEIDDFNKLFKIDNEERFNMVVDSMNKTFTNSLEKYKNEIV